MAFFSKRGLAIAACIAAVFIWGASFVATKIALATFHPLHIITLRTFIGIIVLLPFLLVTKEITVPSRKEMKHLFLFGLIGVAIYQWLQAVGVQWTGASQTSWVTASAPVFMVLLGWLFLKERIDGWQIVGLCLALGGSLLVVSSEDGLGMSSNNLIGLLILFVSALVWAGYSVLAKYLVKEIHPLRLTFYSLLVGLIFLIAAVTVVNGWTLPGQVSSKEWFAIAFLGFGSTGLAYIFYFYALKWSEIALVAVI